VAARAAALHGLLEAALDSGAKLVGDAVAAILATAAGQSCGTPESCLSGSPTAARVALWLVGLQYLPSALAEGSPTLSGVADSVCQAAINRALAGGRPFLSMPTDPDATLSLCNSSWYEKWGATLVRIGAASTLNKDLGISVRAAAPHPISFSGTAHIDEAHEASHLAAARGYEHGLVVTYDSSPVVAAPHPPLPWRFDGSVVLSALTKSPAPTPSPSANISSREPSPSRTHSQSRASSCRPCSACPTRLPSQEWVSRKSSE